VDPISDSDPRPARSEPAPGVVLLPRFAAGDEAVVLAGLAAITSRSPFRHMQTRGGFRMSVAMTTCGAAGWITDRRGYRYDTRDPLTDASWPPMPAAWRALAERAAGEAGGQQFSPDACLVNRYAVGARMSLHQDRNEADFDQPVVSASFGLPATFLFGGLAREQRPLRIPLLAGDVIAWGGPARLAFHGVAPLKAGPATPFGEYRINLTFRRAR